MQGHRDDEEQRAGYADITRTNFEKGGHNVMTMPKREAANSPKATRESRVCGGQVLLRGLLLPRAHPQEPRQHFLGTTLEELNAARRVPHAAAFAHGRDDRRVGW